MLFLPGFLQEFSFPPSLLIRLQLNTFYFELFFFTWNHVLLRQWILESFIECESHSVVSDSCNHMDCRLPGSSVRGIFQARVLEWVAISFSRGSSWPRDQTQVSCIAGRFFTIWANWVVQYKWIFQINYSLAFKAPTCLIITNIKRSFHKNLYNILSPFYNSCILTRILVTKKNSSTL